MTTPKGSRRRGALLDAAVELLREDGFDGVRHRAVAERAGLPLSATTYYFDSLEDLVAAAVRQAAAAEFDAVRTRLQTGTGNPVELVLDVLVGTEPDRVLARYELLVAAGRRPWLRPVMQQVNAEVRTVLGEVLTGHDAELLMAVVDGAVVGALTEADSDPRAAARTLLIRHLNRNSDSNR